MLASAHAAALAATEAAKAAVDSATESAKEAAAQAAAEAAAKAAAEAAAKAAGLASMQTASEGDEEAVEICTTEAIDAAFKAYESRKSPEQIKRVQVLLRLFGYDPKEIDGKMGPDTDKALTDLCKDYKVDEFLTADEQSKEDSSKYLAKSLISLLEEPGPIQQRGEDCGCSRDFSALVYGFYPYLLARSEDRNVDFSLFDRIGFNMQVLDDGGNIPRRLQWSDENESGKNIAGFLSKAHKHRVKVDATFYALNWQGWQGKENAISNAVSNIVKTARQEFHESDAKLWREFFSQRVDGVNIYFDDYNKSSSAADLVEIVQNLSEELRREDLAVELNIILGFNQSDFGEELLTGLKQILVGDEAVVNKVFVFLPKNTLKSRKNSSEAKKALRQKVENAFSGNNRTKVLRKIIPITTPVEIDFEPLPKNDEQDSQFDDDLIYLKDNFAGVGLWPLVPESESEAKEIEKALARHYQANDGYNVLGEILDDYAPGLCEFVCPNRILFYLGLGLLVGILVTYALLAFWNCRLRAIYRRYFLYFIALFLFIALVFVLTLVCDPAWERRVDSVVIGILLLVIVGVGWRSIRKAVQPPSP